MVIQLRSLATLSHRRSLALVGRAPGPNTNSNEVLGVEDKFREGGGVGADILYIYIYIYFFFFFGGFSLAEDDLFINFSWGAL